MRRVDLLTHGQMVLRSVMRRRTAMAVLVLLPVAFYLASNGALGRSVRAMLFGTSWALSTAAFFAVVSAHEIEPRLELAGPSRRELAAARTAALAVLALGLAAGLFLVVLVDQDLPDPSATALGFGITGVVSVALGTALASSFRREMEGALLLFMLTGLQAVSNPFDAWTRLLPFWSSREVSTYAVDGPTEGSLISGLVHAGAVVGVSVAISIAAGRRSGGRWFPALRSRTTR